MNTKILLTAFLSLFILVANSHPLFKIPTLSSDNYKQNANATVYISASGRDKIKVVLSGTITAESNDEIVYRDIPSGNYTISIAKYTKITNGNQTSFGYVEIYNQSLYLQPNTQYEFVVSRGGKIFTDVGNNLNWDRNYNPVVQNNNNNQGSRPVNDTEFAAVTKAIRDGFYAPQMLSTAKVVMKNNLFTLAQIRTIIKLFNYDTEKLSVAKFGYDYCTEKGQYFTVAEEFFYLNTKTDLMNFISSR